MICSIAVDKVMKPLKPKDGSTRFLNAGASSLLDRRPLECQG